MSDSEVLVSSGFRPGRATQQEQQVVDHLKSLAYENRNVAIIGNEEELDVWRTRMGPTADFSNVQFIGLPFSSSWEKAHMDNRTNVTAMIAVRSNNTLLRLIAISLSHRPNVSQVMAFNQIQFADGDH